MALNPEATIPSSLAKLGILTMAKIVQEMILHLANGIKGCILKYSCFGHKARNSYSDCSETENSSGRPGDRLVAATGSPSHHTNKGKRCHHQKQQGRNDTCFHFAILFIFQYFNH